MRGTRPVRTLPGETVLLVRALNTLYSRCCSSQREVDLFLGTMRTLTSISMKILAQARAEVATRHKSRHVTSSPTHHSSPTRRKHPHPARALTHLIHTIHPRPEAFKVSTLSTFPTPLALLYSYILNPFFTHLYP